MEHIHDLSAKLQKGDFAYLGGVFGDGLILFSAGTNVIRMVPPLVITKADVDEMITKLKKSF